MIKYHVKWVNGSAIATYYPEKPRIGKEVVEENNLGVFIVGLINDGCIVIQVEPI